MFWCVVVKTKFGFRLWNFVDPYDVHRHSPCIIFVPLQVWIELCLNVCQPHSSIFHYKIHNVMHTFDVKLTCANHDLQIKVFFVLMNALHCCRWTLPWTKGLTNYFDVDWLCIENIIPRLDWLFGGGRLLITSSSHLIVQRTTSLIWMQTWVHDQKNIFKKIMISKNMIKK